MLLGEGVGGKIGPGTCTNIHRGASLIQTPLGQKEVS